MKCKKCNADLTHKGMVRRTYHLPDGACCDVYGHYTADGDFEPDTKPQSSLDGAKTFDGDDSCFRCDKVVG